MNHDMSALSAKRPRSSSSLSSASVPASAPDDAAALRAAVQKLIRSIGLLAENRTPCGEPLPVSYAHALMVLLEAQHAKEHPRQQDLGRVLGINKSNIARLCEKMERAGHLKQKRCTGDGRARLLTLTERGARVAAAVESKSRAHFQELLVAIPDESRSSILYALAVLTDAMAQNAAQTPSPRRARTGSQASTTILHRKRRGVL
jgi:DNA-binding MarR family transcriptional regulator